MPRLILVEATNFGPSDGRLGGVTVRLRSPPGKPRAYATVKVMDSIYTREPEFDAGYPSKVLIGETKKSYLPFSEQSIFRRGVVRIGVTDAFGRQHWAPRRHVNAIKSELKKAYPGAWTKAALVEVNAKTPR